MQTTKEELVYLADQQAHARARYNEEDTDLIRESKVIEWALRQAGRLAQCCTAKAVAWQCIDERHEFRYIKGIVTVDKETVEAWSDGGIAFVGLGPIGVPAEGARDSALEEAAQICDQHAHWAEEKITEPPESRASQAFAATSNAADDCAAMIRKAKRQPPAASDYKATALQWCRENIRDIDDETKPANCEKPCPACMAMVAPSSSQPGSDRERAIDEAAALMQRWSDEAAECKNDPRCDIQANVCRNAATAIRNLKLPSTEDRNAS